MRFKTAPSAVRFGPELRMESHFNDAVFLFLISH